MLVGWTWFGWMGGGWKVSEQQLTTVSAKKVALLGKIKHWQEWKLEWADRKLKTLWWGIGKKLDIFSERFFFPFTQMISYFSRRFSKDIFSTIFRNFVFVVKGSEGKWRIVEMWNDIDIAESNDFSGGDGVKCKIKFSESLKLFILMTFSIETSEWTFFGDEESNFQSEKWTTWDFEQGFSEFGNS